MRRKFLAALVAASAVAGATMFSLASPASAQTGSGIGTCTAVTGTQNVGNVNIGQRFLLQVAPTCVFTPGATVTVTINGVVLTKVANASGFVVVDVTVLSATQLSIDDPVLTPAVCGTNTVTASGPSTVALGGVSTQTALFTVVCPTTPVVVTPVTPTQGRLSLTGANSLRFGAIALALMAVGSIAVVGTRRRRSTTVA